MVLESEVFVGRNPARWNWQDHGATTSFNTTVSLQYWDSNRRHEHGAFWHRCLLWKTHPKSNMQRNVYSGTRAQRITSSQKRVDASPQRCYQSLLAHGSRPRLNSIHLCKYLLAVDVITGLGTRTAPRILVFSSSGPRNNCSIENDLVIQYIRCWRFWPCFAFTLPDG